MLSGASGETCSDVILKNFFGDDPAKRAHADALAAYVTRELYCMQLTTDDDLVKGHVRFSREPFAAYRPPPPPPASEPPAPVGQV